MSSLLAVELALSALGPLAGTLGFSKRGIMNGPDGKPIHAELTLRGTTLMLGPENPAQGKRIAKTVGASPARLFLYVENVEKIVAKALSLGVTAQGQVMDMLWGDSSRRSSRPRGIRAEGGHAQGRTYVVGKKMTEQIGQQPAGAVTGGLSGHSLDDPLLARFGVKCLRSRYTGGGLCSNIPD